MIVEIQNNWSSEFNFNTIDLESIDIELTKKGHITRLELEEYGYYYGRLIESKIHPDFKATNSIFFNNLNNELNSVFLIRYYSVKINNEKEVFTILLYYKIANNYEEYDQRIASIENYDNLSYGEQAKCLLSAEELLYEEEFINLCKENIKSILLPKK